MRAFAKVGDAINDIELTTVPVPAAGAGEMLVQVKAIGVGVHDGYFLPREMSYPYPVGIEAAGMVVDVGDKVTDYGPGDRVVFVSAMQSKGGTWAEYAVVSQDALIFRIPDGMSCVEAAAVPVAGNTVLCSLYALPPDAGDSLFIAGASGAIGTLAIQIATARGYRVAGSSSSRNHDHLKVLGADLAVDYNDPDWPELVRRWNGGGVDAAIAVQPGTGADSMSVVRDGGHVVTVSRDQLTSEREITVAYPAHEPDLSDQLGRLLHDATRGKVRLVFDRVLPFKDGLTALHQTQTYHARGKLVLDLAR